MGLFFVARIKHIEMTKEEILEKILRLRDRFGIKNQQEQKDSVNNARLQPNASFW